MSLETEFFDRSEKSTLFTNIFAKKVQPSGPHPQSQSQYQKQNATEMQIVAEQNYLRGKQEGINQAADAATQEAKKYFDNEILAIQQYVTQVELCLATLKKDMLSDVVRLSIAIAQKITMAHMTLNSVAVLPIIHKAIEMLPSLSQSYQIRLNPLDAQHIETYLNTHYKDRHISLITDDSIQVGGAIVSTETNQVDATYEQRWKQIADALSADCQWTKKP